MVKHELRVKSCELRVASSNSQVANANPRFMSSNSRVQEYEKSYSYSSMKNQVNSLKISSFPKILSLKSFGNS